MLFTGLRERRGVLRMRRDRITSAEIAQNVQVAEWRLPVGAAGGLLSLAEAIVRWCGRTAETSTGTTQRCYFELVLVRTGTRGRALDSVSFGDLELADIGYPEGIAAEIAGFLAADTGDAELPALRVSAALFSSVAPGRRLLRAAS